MLNVLVSMNFAFVVLIRFCFDEHLLVQRQFVMLWVMNSVLEALFEKRGGKGYPVEFFTDVF